MSVGRGSGICVERLVSRAVVEIVNLAVCRFSSRLLATERRFNTSQITSMRVQSAAYVLSLLSMAAAAAAPACMPLCDSFKRRSGNLAALARKPNIYPRVLLERVADVNSPVTKEREVDVNLPVM